jgi:hypothetical protein
MCIDHRHQNLSGEFGWNCFRSLTPFPAMSSSLNIREHPPSANRPPPDGIPISGTRVEGEPAGPLQSRCRLPPWGRRGPPLHEALDLQAPSQWAVQQRESLMKSRCHLLDTKTRRFGGVFHLAVSGPYPANRDARAALTSSVCGACTDWTGYGRKNRPNCLTQSHLR